MFHHRIRRACLTAFFVFGLPMASLAGSPADFEAFEKEIRPLLVENCLKCHGGEKQKGGLRLDSRNAMLDGGESGAAIVAGRPAESLLIAAVRRETELKMPPAGKLSAQQVDALQRWIASGAPWPENRPLSSGADGLADSRAKHWAFQPIGDPKPPALSDPSWIKTPVDAFVKSALDAKGLSISPPASRQQWIRRVTFDLTGLPPTSEEVRAFVNDNAPDAYEKLVDRLLASPRYGEQWGRHWLDVARYADTKGYVYAREERFLVQAPAYRDWVVKAFNDDMPYDRFLVDQIAADQAEPENKSALAALGFLTVGRRFLGVTHDIIDDRIDVVCRGTMGLTAACARCHDHKFDPIPTADYYSLYGVFQNVTERQVRLAEPTEKDEATLAFEKELTARTEKLRQTMQTARAEAAKRVRSRIADYLLIQLDMSKVPQEGFDVILGPDDLTPASVRRWQRYLAEVAKEDDPIFRPWRQYADPQGGTGPVPASDGDLGSKKVVNRRVAEAFAKPPASIVEVAERYKKLFDEVDRLWQEAVKASEMKKTPLPERLDDPDAEALRQVLYSDRGPCAIPDEPIVSNEFYFDTKNVEEIWKLQGEVDRWLIQSPKAPPYAVAVVDRAELRQPRIFKRGSPANQGDEVPRRFLQVVSGPGRKPFEHGSGRIDMARAIVDPSNPLTARVWVNRIWMNHFGAGLVRTPSDFGLRAEPPSHPELLDWLARRLIANGWSTKSIHRLILLSATYQQQSGPKADLEAQRFATRIDPENRYLWRMNPHRLTFEEAHDSALAVTGELDLHEGGRASELFPKGGTNVRRALYGLVDRQFLSNVLRMFDFANPDMHAPSRSETTVPQQALFAMNHPFIADRAIALAAKFKAESPESAVKRLYQAVYQRDPSEPQLRVAIGYLGSASAEEIPAVPAEVLAWTYGYGKVDAKGGPALNFTPLPHFNGSAWSGGEQWPDAKLGWVQLTAQGGHPGNDLDHAAIRRWTANKAGTVAIKSTLTHEVAEGDGIRARVVSSRHGVLKTADVHNGKADFGVETLAVEPGDTIDFIVDIRNVLNSDQYLWSAEIRELNKSEGGSTWDSVRDFSGPPSRRLTPLEQLAQVLLMANEFMFID